MAKMITREITVTTYTFGRINLDTMAVEIPADCGKMDVVEPLKARELAAYEKANNVKLIKTEENSDIMGMTIQEFFEAANIVTRPPSQSKGTAEK